MMARLTPRIRKIRPTKLESAPNEDTQNRWFSTATGAEPGDAASSPWSTRPRIGPTPSIEK